MLLMVEDYGAKFREDLVTRVYLKYLIYSLCLWVYEVVWSHTSSINFFDVAGDKAYFLVAWIQLITREIFYLYWCWDCRDNPQAA